MLAAFLAEEDDAAPWNGVYAIATPRRSFNMLFNMSNVLRGGARAGGSLMAYSGSIAGEAACGSSRTARCARATSPTCARCCPARRVAETVIHRWEHGLPYVRPGRHRLQGLLERRYGRPALAGDYLGSRYTDTAIATGFCRRGADRGARARPRVGAGDPLPFAV